MIFQVDTISRNKCNVSYLWYFTTDTKEHVHTADEEYLYVRVLNAADYAVIRRFRVQVLIDEFCIFPISTAHTHSTCVSMRSTFLRRTGCHSAPRK